MMEEVFSVGVEKMSKSKKNVVSPVDIFEKYGADAARMFMLSDTPYEKEFEWTENGINSVYKYLQKIWKFTQIINVKQGVVNEKMIKEYNKFLNNYINCFSRFEFNVAIAKLREFTNFLATIDYNDKNNSYTLYEIMKNVIICISPICPYIAETMWSEIGCEGLVCQQSLPKIDNKYLEETTIAISISINGKFKLCIKLDKNLDEKLLIEEAKKNEKISNYLSGKDIKKTIVANSKTGKIINFII